MKTMRWTRTLLLTLTFIHLSLSLPANAQSSGNQQKIDLREDPRIQDAVGLLEVWVEAQKDFQHLPGVSMGVVHDQELVWSKGFGYTDLESKKPATPDTIYSICSISKLFTSVGVMQLYDQGKLRLDDTVKDILPWFNIQETYPDSVPISVRGVLSHASGLPRESDYTYWTGPDFPFPSRAEMMAKLTSQSTLYPAERYFQYSNLGLTLAGELISELSGQSYPEHIKTRVFGPLKLRDTTTDLPEKHLGGQLATGYGALTRDGDRPKLPLFQARGIAAAAGYGSTVNDLAKFASWQFRLLASGKEEVLRASTLREMQRVQWIDPDWGFGTSRGLGFWVRRQDDKTFVGHGGSCPGYRSEFRLDAKNKIGAIFMTNATAMDPTIYTRRAHQILGDAIVQTLEAPGHGKARDSKLDIYTGLYRSVWGEVAVVHWKGELALLGLPTTDPLTALVKIQRSDIEHTFRRLLKDGALGEEIRFDLGGNGQVERMWRHSNYNTKVR